MFELQYRLHNMQPIHHKLIVLENEEEAVALAKLLRHFGQKPSLFWNAEYEYNFGTNQFECLW